VDGLNVTTRLALMFRSSPVLRVSSSSGSLVLYRPLSETGDHHAIAVRQIILHDFKDAIHDG
jgi:hypothetical protein